MRVRFSGAHDQAVGFVFHLLFMLFLSGCGRSNEELPVTPPATHPLARECIGYGVVNVSFIHLLGEPGGLSQGYLRRGTVVRILERRIDRESRESWVLAEENDQEAAAVPQGWLQETALDIFDNESRANTASKAIKQ